jgi:hypothetical protein
LVIPLPAWKTTRERVTQQLEETKLKQQGKTKNENKTQIILIY